MPRDITAREIWKMCRKGCVYLDMTGISEEIIDKKLAELADDCLTYLHKDIRKEPIPVCPGIHYFMGGILVDRKHRTQVRNLYAAGECCSQYHGANRLGGNSLLGAIYGGKVAAETASKESAEKRDCFYEAQQLASEELSPNNKTQLNRILLDALGVVRNESSLQAAIEDIHQMKGSIPLLGQAVLKSAIARRESRGAHFREDFPCENDIDFKKTTVARYDGSKIDITFETIPERR